MKHTIRTCIALLLCSILFLPLFPRSVSVAETGSAATVTEETSPAETMLEESEREPDNGILDTRSVEPRDEDDNF